MMNTTTDQQKIHPVGDVEAHPGPSAPLVPRGYSRSEKGEPDAAGHPYPSFDRTIPVSHSEAPKKRKNRCCRCICWTLLAVILFIVLVVATAGILYLVFHPKIPKYSVDRLRVTNFTIDSNLTAFASFAVSVTARNPNKNVGIYYREGSKLSVSYDGTNLCQGSLPVFYQGHRNTTVMMVVMAGQASLTGDLASALQQQQQTGSVPLRVRGDAPVRIKLGSLKLWKMTFGVRCNLVVDNITTNNFIRIKSSDCKFKKFKLFS